MLCFVLTPSFRESSVLYLIGVIVLILVQFMLYDGEVLHSLLPEKMKKMITIMIWIK